MTLSGHPMDNGSAVERARLRPERRLVGADADRHARTVGRDGRGGHRLRLVATRTADRRLACPGTAATPGGWAACSPKAPSRSETGRVAGARRLPVRGGALPRRPVVVQVRSAGGWETVRRIRATSRRFAVRVGTGRLGRCRVRLRLRVPRGACRRFVAAPSRRRGVLVYDRFVVR